MYTGTITKALLTFDIIIVSWFLSYPKVTVCKEPVHPEAPPSTLNAKAYGSMFSAYLKQIYNYLRMMMVVKAKAGQQVIDVAVRI